jgi:hypothetical protein
MAEKLLCPNNFENEMEKLVRKHFDSSKGGRNDEKE